MDSCVTLLTPLSSQREHTLFRLAALADDQAVPVLLCGAFARDILFEHMHGIASGRHTVDIDISVRLHDWAGYERLGDCFRQHGFRNPFESHPEKFVDGETGQELDLLPFGGVSLDGLTIEWPADRSRWNVVGFEDALAHALWLEVRHGEQIRKVRVISVPALVLLKIIAMNDRPGDRRQKDSGDIAFVLENYLDIGNRSRLRTDGMDSDVMPLVSDDVTRAVAMLLGRDIAAMASPRTHEYLGTLLAAEIESGGRCHLAQGLAKACCNGDFGKARALLSALRDGLQRCWPLIQPEPVGRARGCGLAAGSEEGRNYENRERTRKGKRTADGRR